MILCNYTLVFVVKICIFQNIFKLHFPFSLDTVTPLKKRRLMRESLEAAASPMSPTNQSPESCNTASNSMNESNFKSETTLDDSDQLLLHVKTECSHSDLTLTSKENSPSKSDGLRVDPSESPVKSVKEVNESIKEVNDA